MGLVWGYKRSHDLIYGLHNWKSEIVFYWDEDPWWKRDLGMVKGYMDQEFGCQVWVRY